MALAPDRHTVLALTEGVTEPAQLASALRGQGFDVIGAGSIGDALRLLTGRPTDAVLLPLSPAGRDTCAAIRSADHLRAIPILMIASLDDPRLVADAIESGADDCALPSADPIGIGARLRARIRRARADDARRSAEAATAARVVADKERELSALNYAVSHDLRAPLRAIDGFSHIVLEEGGETVSAKHRDYLQRICNATHEMSQLIDDLLQLSRVGRAELRRGAVNLSELARRAAQDLQTRSNRAVEVVVEEGLVVEADRRLMQIVMEQLLDNSWKFTTGTAAPRIECCAQPAGRDTVFVVRDNGVGFDMKRADKLFQPFQRLHGPAEFPGTGIGLAVVRRIIDRHGGRVWAEARAGQGATFLFTVPTAVSAAGPVSL